MTKRLKFLIKALYAIFIATLWLAPNLSTAGTLSILEEQRWVTVSKVYDGDTFLTRQGERVRLLGINTPEVQHHDSPAQVGGNKAKKALTKLILGKQVRLRFDQQKKDRYQRSLAQVWLKDGLWVNAWLLEQGYAHVYTFEPNNRWCKALLIAEKKARQQHLGIWSTSRFKILHVDHIVNQHIGQFRVIEATILKQSSKKKWRYRLNNIILSIPKRYRKAFKHPPHLKLGQKIVIRGKIRSSRQNRLFLALHSPYDLELIP
ncbi:MAG: thermonuclease family protein [Mariprofundaceae bacterium]